MDLRIDPSRATPPSRQIVEAILDAVAGGRMGPGDRLPSVRALAAEARVNANTVGKAYRDLRALGAVAARAGTGVFVTANGPAFARSVRRRATLDALQGAIAAAVDVGHEPAELSSRIERWLAAAGRARMRARVRATASG